MHVQVIVYFIQVVHFCPALYSYVVNEMKKHIILVLNKVDLAPVELVTAWKSYLKETYPLLHIVCFTSHPRDSCPVGLDPGSGRYSVLGTCCYIFCTQGLPFEAIDRSLSLIDRLNTRRAIDFLIAY